MELDIPSDPHGEGSFAPVSALDDRHLPAHEASWSIEDFMAVAVIGRWGWPMGGVEVDPIMSMTV